MLSYIRFELDQIRLSLDKLSYLDSNFRPSHDKLVMSSSVKSRVEHKSS